MEEYHVHGCNQWISANGKNKQKFLFKKSSKKLFNHF